MTGQFSADQVIGDHIYPLSVVDDPMGLDPSPWVAPAHSGIASSVLQPVDFVGNVKDWIQEVRDSGTLH